MKRILQAATLLCFVMLYACASSPRPQTRGSIRHNEIQDIQMTQTAEGVDVVIQAMRPLIYTSFRLPDPDRFVVDLVGVGMGKFTQRITAEQGPIRWVQPRGALSALQGAQLEIVFAEPAEAMIQTSENRLVVKVTRLTTTPPPPDQAIQVDTQPPLTQISSFASPLTDARWLREVRVATQPLRLIMTADGLLLPQHQLLNSGRLVIDLPNIQPAMSLETLSVGNALIRQVRMGQHPDKVRLVLDLLAPISYAFRQEGYSLVVYVSPETAPLELPQMAVPENTAPTETATVTPPQAKPVGLPVVTDTGHNKATLPITSFASPLTDARWLRDVRVETQPVRLIITADGVLSPQHQLLDSGRLVIDLPNIQPAMSLETLSVRNALIRQVRMGQHPDKVRLVLDLLAPISYAFRQEGYSLVVYVSPETEPIELPKMAMQEDAFSLETTTVIPTPSQGAPIALPAPEAVLPPVLPAPEVIAAPRPATSIGADPSIPAPPLIEEARAKPIPHTSAPPPVSSLPVKSDPAMQKVDLPPSKRISLDFQDADVTNVLRLLGEISGENMVIGEDVTGKVNLKLNNVGWEQALDIILKTTSLGKITENNIIRIGTLSNLTKQQDEEAKAKEARVRVEDLTTRIIGINYSDAGELGETLKKNISPRGDITVDARTNTLIIKDIAPFVREVEGLVKQLDTPTPQVMIEARIVQVAPSFNRSLGIQWGINYNDIYKANQLGIGGATASPALFGVPQPSFAVNLPASPALGGVGMTFGRLTSNPLNLDLRLSAGESQGLTRIISRPKITVLDNQEAKISQGESIPYSTISSQGTQTTFKEATLSLNVTPHISPDGGVLMKIHVTKDAPGPVQPGASGPSILKKEASTNVLVQDGETTVIGGIYETSQIDSEDGVPFLRSIPGLGWLFKTVQKREQISELLVFLTPKVIKEEKTTTAP